MRGHGTLQQGPTLDPGPVRMSIHPVFDHQFHFSYNNWICLLFQQLYPVKYDFILSSLPVQSLQRGQAWFLASQLFSPNSISFLSFCSLWDLIGSPPVFFIKSIFGPAAHAPCPMGDLGIRVMHHNAVLTDGFHQLLVVFLLRCDSLTSALLIHSQRDATGEQG